MTRIFAGFLLALAAAFPAAGQGIGNLLGNGGSLSVPVALPGGLSGDVTVSFESVSGLSLPNLGISAQLISPFDPGLLARLPGSASIPAGFPVLVRIEPTAAGGLAFTGIAKIQLRTLPLPGAPDSSMRMFAAPAGGPFADITKTVQTATDLKTGTSYRVLGSKGGFSEFLLVTDHAPAGEATAAKLDHLDQILADNAGAISAGLRATLSAQVAAVRGHAEGGETAAAIQDLDLFLATVQQHSGTDIPNVWRAARDLVNAAGLLRAGGETLRFSLQQELGQ